MFRKRASTQEARPPREPGRLLRAWRKARRATDRFRLLRDVTGALLIVLIVVGTLATATGGTWPPFVVIESESMMHPLERHYGEIGTIDVGDIVFLRAVHDPAKDVHLWVDGGDSHYGRPGDVIAYAQDGDRANTTIIHRAITRLDVVRLPNGSTEYRLRWLEGKTIKFGAEGVYFPPLGFDESTGYTPQDGYKPLYSGYVTKGDNAVSNALSDQAGGLSRLVDPSWIDAKAYGEVPWMGLAKLALQWYKTNEVGQGWYRVGNAYAPLELWTCFFAVLTIVFAVPLSLDTWRAHRASAETRRAHREARAVLRARKEEQKRRAKEAKLDPSSSR